MITTENVLRVLNYEGYDGILLLKKAIEAGVLETAPYSGAFTSHSYCITKEYFFNYLYKLGLNDSKLQHIMNSVQTIS